MNASIEVVFDFCCDSFNQSGNVVSRREAFRNRRRYDLCDGCDFGNGNIFVICFSHKHQPPFIKIISGRKLQIVVIIAQKIEISTFQKGAEK